MDGRSGRICCETLEPGGRAPACRVRVQVVVVLGVDDSAAEPKPKRFDRRDGAAPSAGCSSGYSTERQGGWLLTQPMSGHRRLTG